ncbi:hypothetical protein Sru01_29000 [Sphaerisporangium rufum]|uniref:FG-GAP repeat-containing protein n=1 Tax=Sphaerisporangium rufum TaxID=1381558 RepID=A0A919R2M3_9ACTN|nr:hypothetical protein [Sphaerisporangium rufum]GII77918.1 hypothetical protein Sru01_29000 [Sphaerisporangium rufum]
MKRPLLFTAMLLALPALAGPGPAAGAVPAATVRAAPANPEPSGVPTSGPPPPTPSSPPAGSPAPPSPPPSAPPPGTGSPGATPAPATSGPVTTATAVPPPVAPPSPRPATDPCARAGAADFDGDGHDDIVVGDPFGDPLEGWVGGGRLYLLAGTPYGLPAVRAAAFAHTAGDGGWVARAGHLDGDRCLDLVVANPYRAEDGARAGGQVTAVPGAGAVQVYWGGPGFGRAGAPRTELRAPEPRNGAHFGWSLAVAPGLLAAGAPYEDADGVPDSGAAYLFRFGGAGGRQAGPPRRLTQETGGVPGDGEPGDLFGWSLALGALGGGPGTDLAVGAPYEDRDVAGTALPDAGKLTVLLDPAGGGVPRGVPADLSTLGTEVTARPGDLFGYALASGERDGRHYLAVGAPGADAAGVRDAGAVQLLRAGDPGRDPRPAGTLRQGAHQIGDAAEPGDRFGFSLAFAGGVLAVGVPFEGDAAGHPETGAVHAVPIGEPDRPGTDPPTGPATVITSRVAQTYDHFGWAVGGAGGGWLVIGVPDRERTGAVALARPTGGHVVMLRPGDGTVPVADPRRPAQVVDFGAALAG